MSLIITLAVTDIDRSEYFYRDILQLPVKRFTAQGSSNPALLISHGDTSILLREAQVLEAHHPAAFQHLERQSRGVGVSFDFQIDNLALVQRVIERQQLSCLYELEDQEHGFRELWLYDPDHYLIILTQVDNPDR
ncbi:MAG: VOC family protein [Thermodesulfobacteriota bacterium]|nr:VOC family protein [Thermodesulfobacteriota bacterium]